MGPVGLIAQMPEETPETVTVELTWPRMFGTMPPAALPEAFDATAPPFFLSPTPRTRVNDASPPRIHADCGLQTGLAVVADLLQMRTSNDFSENEPLPIPVLPRFSFVGCSVLVR
jgi:hypothetical protein